MTTQTRLEQIQHKTNGIRFIKSYPILTTIKQITPTQVKLIELVLSYQDNGKPFKMKYQTIADIINIELQSVKDMVGKLKKLNIIITDHKKNDVVNGVGRGSSTGLTIDLDVLISMIEPPAESKPAPTPETVQEPEPAKATPVEQQAPAEPIEPIEPAKEPEPVQPAPTNQKKTLMIERYKSKFRYSKAGDTMTPAEFHNLTDNRFMVLPKVTSRLLRVPADNFDVFWDKVQELKKDLLEFEQAQQ